MANYKIADRVRPDILNLSSKCALTAYPFHLLFPSRFATDEKFAMELESRLKAIPYPYKLARDKGTPPLSTYDILEKRGAFDSLFQPGVITSLREWVNGNEQWTEIRHLRSANTEAGKAFRRFHVPLAKELARHEAALRKLKATYKGEIVEDWIGPYIRTVEQQLMLEIALLRTSTEDEQDSDTKATRDTVKWVYEDVVRALKQVNIANRALACHLTSIVCSPNCIETKTLSPDPESVRKLLARDPDKNRKNSSN